MRLLIAVFSMIAVVPAFAGCHDPSCDPRDMAVYHALQQRIGEQHNETEMVIDNDYGPDKKRELLHQKTEINRVRAWAQKLQPGTIRSSYLGWLDWYADGNAEALSEWQTHKSRKEQDDYERKSEECYRKSLQAKHSIPTPP